MHLADLKSYLEADGRLCALYANPDEWARKAILNVAGSGKFSSDRTIAEYANEIWNVQSLPSAGERVNAGIRADNYAVSAANPRLLSSYALIISVSDVHCSWE